MPYKDKDKQREAAKQSMAKKRQLTPGTVAVGSVNPSDVNPNVGGSNIRDLPPAWEHVREFISRPPRRGDISNLEKLKRIAGALGKQGDEVWFGGVTMGQIGHTIGAVEVELPAKRPY